MCQIYVSVNHTDRSTEKRLSAIILSQRMQSSSFEMSLKAWVDSHCFLYQCSPSMHMWLLFVMFDFYIAFLKTQSNVQQTYKDKTLTSVVKTIKTIKTSLKKTIKETLKCQHHKSGQGVPKECFPPQRPNLLDLQTLPETIY